ncbi:MAG: Ig-like domain-containing protein [Saprospiraceae bacterium]|nr:Ig-like domain-containing protein [Saprospiraceae bacterium]
MKTRIFLAVAFLCSLFLTPNVQAQVTSVNYQLKYNTDSCRYDAFIIINAGTATSVARRTQTNAQYSIVVPTGTGISVARSYMPLKDNQTYTGTEPAPWTITTSVIAPAAAPDYDFHSITPNLATASQYNNLASGDTVKIFSIDVDRINACGDSIWIFRNGIDPGSGAPGMGGGDFRNGFTIGGPSQRYNANATQKNPPKPVIISALTTCSAGIEIDLTATTTACQGDLIYAWTGPFSYSSTTQDVSIFPSTVNNIGDYKVIVTDSLDCKDSITVTVTNKPNAGADQTVCAGSTNNISGTDPTSGTWSAQTGNPAGATLGLLPAGNATVTFTNAASGTYRFIYATPTCQDTMRFTVNAKPVVGITGSNNICRGATTMLSPTSGGTWVSNNPGVASVTNGGLVTGLAGGSATFTFTDGNGCTNITNAVTVNPPPTVAISGTSAVCIGSTTTLIPATGGTWVSLFPLIATVTNAGLVTGVSAGTGRFVFTETATGCISDTLNVTVRPVPTVSIASTTICIFGTTTLTPSSGGTWLSSNPLIATVSNAGLATGVGAGKVVFRWTETTTGCQSAPTDSLTVLPSPTVSLAHATRCIGVGTTASALPAGGTWVSLNTSVATIDANTGAITTLASGIATFRYTSLNGCQNTTSALTVNPGPTVLAGSNTLCPAGTTNLTPSTLGTWSSATPAVATVTNVGLVTALTAGTSVMTYTETSTGCQGSLTITVQARPLITAASPNPICVGFTSNATNTTGGSGTWTSLSPAIATINNSGLITGISVGTANVTFTSSTTFCTSLPTSITVINKPVVSITGPTQVCTGFTTTLSPTSGGTWTSSNTAVATVANDGTVTAVGPGTATFTFTQTGGCVSDPTAPITVFINPPTSFTGPNAICVGQTTTVTPTTGGTWSSSDVGVATITNAGLVSGISAGTAQLVYTQTATGCASSPLTVTVNPKPTVALTGPGNICIGGTSTVTPTSGGAWASSNNLVATITNGGVITGVAQGTAIFTFTSTAGCPSDPVISVAIMPKPTITMGPANICVGTTTTLTASTTGTWSSNNPGIATIHATTGVVTGVTAGLATFRFTSTDGCLSDNSGIVTINDKPIVVLNGPASICVGKTTNLSPTTGGTWQSTNLAVATISNAGLVTGISAGTARFIFTNTSTGCISDTSAVVTITQGPAVSITGDDELCIGETTNLSPNSGGTWASSSILVATVTNAGLVTAVSAGQATFVFTDAAGCKSDPTLPVIVHPKPTVAVSGPSTICVGGTTNLSPSSGGTWASSAAGIASVDNSGLVTGVSPGSATFIFTDTNTTCSSDATSPVTVAASPTPTITGPTDICIGGTTTLAPSTGGTWVSNNPTVASVTNGGIVTSIGPGKVTFTFTLTATGCTSAAPTDTVSVSACLNPDFNATFVDVHVLGDVSTNDFTSPGTVYGPSAIMVSKPAGAVDVILVNADGTYDFVSNLVGKYVYTVAACTPPQVSGCPTAELTITVTDFVDPSAQPIANVDFATTFRNTAVTLATLANDGCMRVSGCSLNPASVTVITPPSSGSTSVNIATGDITYTPANNFVGIIEYVYQVCVTGQPANCATAKQIVTISDPAADNTTVALDDFAVGPQDTQISGNVSDNDSDPEGDYPLDVTPYTASPAEGDFELFADGSWTFDPAEWFFGPVEFTYTSCDTDGACADATLHLLIVPDLTIKVRVYLEGSLMENQGTSATDGRPMMRDNLRLNPFTGRRVIPNSDPFRFPVESPAFPINGTNAVDTVVLDIANTLGKPASWANPGTLVPSFQPVNTGVMTKFATIPNPSTVFSVTGQEAIVDWVYIELRSKSNNQTIIATRTGLLQRDGDVVDLDGIHGLRFPGLAVDDYYVVVRHFRHLGAMTDAPQTPAQLFDLVDFTTDDLPVFDFGTSHPVYTSVDFSGLAMNYEVYTGYRCLWAGDFDGNGKIKAANPGDDLNVVFFDVLDYPTNIPPYGNYNANFDFAYGYLLGDFDMNGKIKFDNPNDDKNMMYVQLLFYPLNLNQGYIANFDFFIEQLP